MPSYLGYSPERLGQQGWAGILRNWRDTGADVQVKELLGQVADHFLVHVQREDKDCYAPAMDYFTPNESAEMLAEFRNHDRAMIHDKYRLMADTLEADR